MSRYIDADALEYDTEWSEYHDGFTAYSQLAIDTAPSIDIVFCKKCKHRPIKEDPDGEDYGFNIIKPNGPERCPCFVEDGWYSWMPKDNFFCGYGESEDE